MQTTSQSELAELIRPFVGTFRAHHRGDGSRIDILHVSNSIDADVRAVTEEGVRVFFYDRSDLIPWSAIRSVTINGAVYVPEREAHLQHIASGHRRYAREFGR